MEANGKNDRNEGTGASPEHNEPAQVGLPQADIEATTVDKNEASRNRRKLTAIAKMANLTEVEIDILATAMLQSADPFRILSNNDPISSIEAAERNARRRVQYTDLMAGPYELGDLLSTNQPPIGIRSKAYVDTEKSIAELTVAVRGARKVMDAFRLAYEEHRTLLNELLRQLEEKKMVAQTLRHNVPKYLLEFARLLEKISCNRNHLRYVNGGVVKAIRQAICANKDAQFDAEAEAEIFQRWLAESPPGSEFHRISRIVFTTLKDSDFNAAREAFAALEMHVATRGDTTGSTDITEASYEEVGNDDGKGTAGLDAAGLDSTETFAQNSRPLGFIPNGAQVVVPYDSLAPEKAGSSITFAEIKGDVSKAEEQPGIMGDRTRFSDLDDHFSPRIVPSLPSEPALSSASLSIMAGALKAPDLIANERVTGHGRLPGGDPFGGILSLARSAPDCVPMWDRKDRAMSAGNRFCMDDWYRFEVQKGPYVLVQLPTALSQYLPIRDEMFPPVVDVKRYGEMHGYSQEEMTPLILANCGRGGVAETTAIMRAELIKTYGQDDEDLLRFWMFLLVGRLRIRCIDTLFPSGYFHGVLAPDPASQDTGVGSFQIVRVSDDGDLKAKMRTPQFTNI